MSLPLSYLLILVLGGLDSQSGFSTHLLSNLSSTSSELAQALPWQVLLEQSHTSFLPPGEVRMCFTLHWPLQPPNEWSLPPVSLIKSPTTQYALLTLIAFRRKLTAVGKSSSGLWTSILSLPHRKARGFLLP
jgi:hypothetical protein